MTELSLRPYLRMKGITTNQGVRACCSNDPRPISLRALLSSFSAPIYEKWQSLGGENGRLGRIRGDLQKFHVGDQVFTGQRFEHGTIIDLGNGTVSAALNNGGAGGGASLPETPYILTLERIKCTKKTQGEAGADELWLRLILSTNASLNEGGDVSSIIDYRNDDVQSGKDMPLDLLLYGGRLPEIFKLSYMAVEVDLDSDAEEVMNVFAEKVKEKEKLWFTAGSDVVEGILWFNIAMNALGTALCVADPNPWVHWIGGIAGTGMEIALKAILEWYKSELIAANELSLLGENLQKESRGQLQGGTGDEPVEVTVFGSSATNKISIFMHVAFSYFENGDIREERRFFGADTDVDYTFTFRHFLGNGSGPAPMAPLALAVEPEYHRSWNERNETSRFLYSANRLTWNAGGAGDIGYEVERSYNGAPFVKAGTVRVRPPSAGKAAYADSFVQTPGDVFQYRIRAYNKNGFSPCSEVLTVTLPVPAAPYGLSAAQTPQPPNKVMIHVYWMVSSLGDEGYMLERSRDGGAFVEVSAVAARKISTEGANYVDGVANPRAGEKIQYRVKGYNEYGDGPYSEVFTVIVK